MQKGSEAKQARPRCEDNQPESGVTKHGKRRENVPHLRPGKDTLGDTAWVDSWHRRGERPII